MGKMSESISRATPRTQPLIYFWQGAAGPSRKLESVGQKQFKGKT